MKVPDKLILGIHDGHNCGASLTRNGKVIASVSEERLTRKKNEVGYPRNSIDDVLRIAGVNASDLDQVVYASLFMHHPDYLKKISAWYRVGQQQQHEDSKRPKAYEKHVYDKRQRERIDAVVDHLSISEQKIDFVEHHLAHLAAAYFTADNVLPDKPILGLTCDGAGDGLSATVSICKNNQIERIASTNRLASLGKVYSRVTYALGMRPWQDEYKVMGLAPYANPSMANNAAKHLKNLLKIDQDTLSFSLATDLSTNYCYQYLREAFELMRFDAVAGGVQQFTEDLLLDWIRLCIKKTGISDLVCGGGVFMNVKSNMRIAELPEVNSIYFMPTASDESLSIGACLYAYYNGTDIIDHSESVFSHLYLGGDYDISAEEAALESQLGETSVSVMKLENTEEAVAELLASGEIVARCCGRMEWGARALGNRSILSSADNFSKVEKLNESVKKRDFWMPFAPSILHEKMLRYVDNPKNLKSYYMATGYRLKPEHAQELSAAMHPRDKTIRPQFVKREMNPRYHALISQFEKLTGRSGILNTSFNLHGEPIVYSPSDAVDVFLRSGLRHLALDHYIISKK